VQTELEVKFLAVDHAALQKKLKSLGADCTHPMRLMRRTVMDFEDGRLEKTVDGFVRVRDEGDKVVATYKQFGTALAIDSAQEIETIVGDYETTIRLFEAIGLRAKSEQETRRENWQLGDCEIVLDEWPWLKPYLEIEGPNQAVIKQAAEKLGLRWEDHVTGSVTVAYRSEYDIPRKVSIAINPRMAFDEPVPDWMQKAKRTAA
jgi:adenylate cyclase, class 2